MSFSDKFNKHVHYDGSQNPIQKMNSSLVIHDIYINTTTIFSN